MDPGLAAMIAEGWSGGRGLVSRGPRWLLGFRPASPDDVERHTGYRPARRETIWRVEVGGRFLRSGGLVYPGGVPFPEELQRQTAVISSEVWLYVDEDGYDVLGMYSWPEAVRRPIASVPRADFLDEDVMDPPQAADGLEFDLRLPAHRDWEPVLVVERSPVHVVAFLVSQTVPEPLNEMLLFEGGGLSLRAGAEGDPTDVDAVVRGHQPPFRRVRAGSVGAAGREQGKALGPQTWPWPAELLWCVDGVSYELKGFASLATLQEVAASVEAVVT